MKLVLVAILVALCVGMVGLIATYQWRQSKLIDLDDSVRAGLPGDFIGLEDGVLSYYLRGAERGETVVLVHGFSTPKFVWDANIGPLVEAGYRVLAYDHYGRGHSDRPDTTYDANLYTRELLNLLDALDIAEPVTLVGYSMGGGNVIGFAAAHPNRVKKLILIAPIGFMPEPSGLTRLITFPGIGEILMDLGYRKLLLEDIEKEVEAGNAIASIRENFVEQLRYKGYMPALLSTIRNYPMNDLVNDYETVGKSSIPVFAIWGTADAVVPFSGARLAQKAIPTMELFPVEGAAHSVTYARAEVVNEILLDLLAR
jgi:pimeloyl-ACP methyl ester carboxylesterase